MTPRPLAVAACTLAIVLAALCAAADTAAPTPATRPAEAEPTDIFGSVLDTVAAGLSSVGSTTASCATAVASFAATLGVPDPATLVELPGIVLAHAADLGRHDAWAAASYHTAPWLGLGAGIPRLSARSVPMLALLVAALLGVNVALACRWRTLTRPNGGEEARCSP